MESLNRSLTSPTEPVQINWPWGGKKFRSTIRPSWEVSGEIWVVHLGWHASVVSVCVFGGWGGRDEWPLALLTCWKREEFIQRGPHRHQAAHMWGHRLVDTHTRRMCIHATCMHTNTRLPVTSLFTSYPLPLTLPHTNKIRLNYPGVPSPTCLLRLLFLQREHFLAALL